MNLVNHTPLVAGYTMATDKTGRESIVVAVKGTYRIYETDRDAETQLAAEQMPLITCDVFTGKPGFSAPLYEIDYAPIKPRCDVLLNGSAHSPSGQPIARTTVTLRVGSMLHKTFAVVGDRTWTKLVGVSATPPKPFTVMPISYNNAFGGVDNFHADEKKHRTYTPNHVGKGFHDQTGAELVEGKPLPNTEEINQPITGPKGKYRPMAFGPLGRAWEHRIKWAGTYDAKWLEAKHPFLPDDFDTRYFQSAPEDQQIDYPRGGEHVSLTNLSPLGHMEFRLPDDLSMPIRFALRDGQSHEAAADVDTLIIEPDNERFALVWRASMPVRRTIREIVQIEVGEAPVNPRAEFVDGKRRYKSLAELVDSSRGKS